MSLLKMSEIARAGKSHSMISSGATCDEEARLTCITSSEAEKVRGQADQLKGVFAPPSIYEIQKFTVQSKRG